LERTVVRVEILHLIVSEVDCSNAQRKSKITILAYQRSQNF
jgi:hypothetical protein